jgi:uncharacterized protein YjbI with pentapeptide repeats
LFGFAVLTWLPALIVSLNLVWLNVAPAEADAAMVRFDPQRWKSTSLERPTWSEAIGQPLDVVSCPALKWGCRYLRVDHRTLVDHVWDDKAMTVLRTDGGDYGTALAGIEGMVLRGRNLRFAVLDDSRLYAADLIGADLSKASLTDARLLSAKLDSTELGGASLNGAQLQGASLNSAELQGAQLQGASLQGASLYDARLQGASLNSARLQGAWLDAAHLQGASLIGAQLQGASRFEARLQGAWLYNAHLQGASLIGAQLQGASLFEARLQGAWLYNAHLQGASLIGAHLQGASLYNAYLQGASLIGAQLQGASLDSTQLQGASLDRAQLQGASLDGVFVWRAKGLIAEESDTIKFTLQKIITAPQRPCKIDEATRADGLCDWSKADFEALKQEISTVVPEGKLRDAALQRIEAVLNPDPVRDDDQNIAHVWLFRQGHNPPTALFEAARATVWREIGCDSDGAPFVVAALARRLAQPLGLDAFSKDSPHRAQLVAAFLDSKNCAGARGISVQTWGWLKLGMPVAVVAATR